MDGWLKQSTAITLRIGPFLDSTDGNTQETALTIAQADVVLSKAGGAFAAKNDATSCTHDTKGYYSCPLNATDTGTLGMLKLAVHVAGALAVWHTFQVVTAAEWDRMCSTGASVADVKTVVDAVKTKTDNLPADPADDSDIDTQLATIAGYIDTEVAAILSAVDTEVAAIKAKTDLIGASVALETGGILADIHDTDLPAVKTDTAAILVDTGTTLDAALAVVDGNVDAIKLNIPEAFSG